MPKTNPNKEIMRTIREIRSRVSNKAWPCMCEKCNVSAINSHLLMRHGILNYVAEDGHVYELRSDAPQAMKKEKMPISFKRRGLNHALSFPVFCKQHDDGLFQEIEKKTPDYTKYHHIALYSYRSLCAEYRKKEIEAECSRRISESIKLWRLMGNELIEEYKASYQFELMGLQNLKFYKEQLQNDIEKGSESYVFFTRELPIRGLYASTISSMFSTEEELISSPLLNTIFIHIIPSANTTQLIIGYHKEHVSEKIKEYVYRWKEAKMSDIGAMLTGVFTQIETWGMSPSLYEQLKPEIVRAYYGKIEESCMALDQNPIEDINLFEGVI